MRWDVGPLWSLVSPCRPPNGRRRFAALVPRDEWDRPHPAVDLVGHGEVRSASAHRRTTVASTPTFRREAAGVRCRRPASFGAQSPDTGMAGLLGRTIRSM